MGHTFHNVLVHVVFATKNREKVLTAAIRESLHAYLAQVVNDEGGKALLVNSGLEHVHILLRTPPKLPVSDLLCRMKANSRPGSAAAPPRTSHGNRAIPSSASANPKSKESTTTSPTRKLTTERTLSKTNSSLY